MIWEIINDDVSLFFGYFSDLPSSKKNTSRSTLICALKREQLQFVNYKDNFTRYSGMSFGQIGNGLFSPLYHSVQEF